MGFVIALLLFVVGYYAYRQNEGDWTNSRTIFCCWWAIMSGLSQMRLYGLFSVSEKTWLVIMLGCVGFCIGAEFERRFIFKVKYISSVSHEEKKDLYIMKKQTFFLVYTILLLYQVVELLNTIRLVNLGVSLADVRAAQYGLGVAKDKITFILPLGLRTYIDYLKSALQMIMTAIGIYAFFEKKEKKYLVASIGLNLIITLSTGGRFAIFNFAIQMLVCFGIVKNSKETNGKIEYEKTVKWLVAIVLCVIIIITVIRGTKIGAIFEMLYTYISCNSVLCDLHIKAIDQLDFCSNGFAGFYGIWCMILPILHKLGVKYPDTYILTHHLVMTGQDWLQVGDELYSNAFLTPFYYLYADFRYIGVLCGMFFLGYIIERKYDDIKNRRNGYNIIFYLVLTQMLILTLQTYPFTSPGNILAIVIMMILVRVKNI